MESRRGCWFQWSWSYRVLGHIGVLGPELRSFTVLFWFWLHPWSWHVHRLASHVLCSPNWPWVHGWSSCLRLWSTGVTGVCHHTWLKHSKHRSYVLQLSTETAFFFHPPTCWIKIEALSLLNRPSLIWEEDFYHKKQAILANGRLATTGWNEI